VLSGRGLCDELITRLQRYYRVCECINECGLKRKEEGRNEGRKEGNRNEWKTVGKKEIKH